MYELPGREPHLQQLVIGLVQSHIMLLMHVYGAIPFSVQCIDSISRVKIEFAMVTCFMNSDCGSILELKDVKLYERTNSQLVFVPLKAPESHVRLHPK